MNSRSGLGVVGGQGTACKQCPRFTVGCAEAGSGSGARNSSSSSRFKETTAS